MVSRGIDTNLVFDDHIVKLVSGILSGNHVTPLSAGEQYFLKNANVLKSINDEIDVGLVEILYRYKSYISANNVLHFLINGYKLGRLSEVLFTLGECAESNLFLSKKDCLELLRSDIPMVWNLYLLGEETTFKEEHTVINRPSIDINRLRDFK